MKEIPIVSVRDIGLLTENAPLDSLRAVGEALHKAFSGCGFVYLLDHGIPIRNVSATFEASRRFFQLSQKEKDAFARNTKSTEGYVKAGRELLDQLKEGEGEKAFHELRESFDALYLTPESPFPDKLVPELRGLFTIMGQDLVRLTGKVLAALSLSLGLDVDFLQRCHRLLLKKGNLATMRSLYYPPIEGPVTPGVTRCGEHSDYGTITFLFQDNLGGLEVRGVDQEWIQARPVKDALLVNMGDMMEVFTNGAFPATRHRVVIPADEVLSRKPRQSFAFFVSPDDDTIVKPIKEEEELRKEKYREMGTAREYVMRQFGKTIDP